MAFQPVPNVVQLLVRGRYYGEEVENTFYYNRVSAPTVGELQTLVAGMDDFWLANCIPLLPADWVGFEVYGKGLSAPIDIQATSTDISGVPGTYAGQGSPGNVTLAFKRLSGLTGRSSNGRIYWMGISEQAVAGNTIISTFVDDTVNTLIAMDDVALGLGWLPCVVSRQQNKVKLAEGIPYQTVTWAVTDDNSDSMRRRLAGRGK